jgi:hypothetical protein
MLKVAQKGQYVRYHKNDIDSSEYGSDVSVNCDRCHKDNIHESKSLKEHDLCLDCVSEINKANDQPVTRMVQNQFENKPNDQPVTKMVQNQFENKPNSQVTRMMQDQFENKPNYRSVTKMMQGQFR